MVACSPGAMRRRPAEAALATVGGKVWVSCPGPGPLTQGNSVNVLVTKHTHVDDSACTGMEYGKFKTKNLTSHA